MSNGSARDMLCALQAHLFRMQKDADNRMVRELNTALLMVRLALERLECVSHG